MQNDEKKSDNIKRNNITNINSQADKNSIIEPTCIKADGMDADNYTIVVAGDKS